MGERIHSYYFSTFLYKLNLGKGKSSSSEIRTGRNFSSPLKHITIFQVQHYGKKKKGKGSFNVFG